MNPTNIEMQQKAAEYAKQTLKTMGIEYPLSDEALSPAENYERIKSYAEQEAALIVQFMRMPSGPRPIVLDTTKPIKKSWEQYND